MGNKNKSFHHPDGLPLFSPLFLSQNTLRAERAVFKSAWPGTACSLASGCFSTCYWTSSLWWKHLPVRSLPLPWLKWWPSVAVGVGTYIHDALQPCKGVRGQCGVVELAVGHTGGRVGSRCPNMTQMLGEGLLAFPTGMAVRGNTNQNFRVFTGKVAFAIWKNTNFSKLLLVWCKGGKTASRSLSLCQILYGKSKMCLKPCQGVPCLLLVKSERFGAAEKPSITGGAMCTVTPRARFRVETCANLKSSCWSQWCDLCFKWTLFNWKCWPWRFQLLWNLAKGVFLG